MSKAINHKWEVGKTYKTRGGWDAKILSVEGPEKHPIITLHNLDVLRSHCIDGAFWNNGREDKCDLMPSKRETYEVYDNGTYCGSFETKADSFEYLKRIESSEGKVIRFIEDGEVTNE